MCAMPKHPRIETFAQLDVRTGTPAAAGYRMPAEFEPISQVWLTRPYNEGSWPGCVEQAGAQWDELRRQIALCGATPRVTQELGLPTNDSWIRDYGPTFVVGREGQLALNDYFFNCWGEVFGPWDHDNLIPQRVAQLEGVPLWVHDEVLEGGSIEVNGCGTVMTTRHCLLVRGHPKPRARPPVEQFLHDTLGTRHVIWLPGEPCEGDDTGGHIDNLARFISPTAVIAVRAPADHPEHAKLEANWQALQAARDQDGQALELFELPMPTARKYHWPADAFHDDIDGNTPASYCNFLICNKNLLFPVFGVPEDDQAIKAIERALPGYQIRPIPSNWLVVGQGGIHCLSQQQPQA